MARDRSVANFDVIRASAVLGSQSLTQGNTFYVKPRTGSDGADGSSPSKAFKTLAAALAACTADQNDTVYLFAESNTAASTTDYQSSTLNWNKDLVHLIGVNSGPLLSQRSRVAFISTYVTASNLFTLSADGCLIENVSFFAGVNSANPTGCFNLTGQRNVIRNCHIAGLGHATMDIAGGYSLQISGGAENLIEDCTIGVDTITLGAQINAQLYFASGATRNWFRGCRFLCYTNHATNHQFIRAAAGSMDRYQVFEDCLFLNAIDSGSTALTQAATIAASGSPAGGVLLVGKTAVIGATDWNATDAGNVSALGYSVTSATVGLGTDVTRA
jgi:hypothetical protein